MARSVHWRSTGAARQGLGGLSGATWEKCSKKVAGESGEKGVCNAYSLLLAYFTVELYSSSLSLAWPAAWSSAAFALAILPVINCSIAA